MKKRSLALVLALVLAVTAVIGGTLAWLTDTTAEVKNTFTTSDIDITLVETPNFDSDNDGKADKWQAKMIPGYEYTKDPVVTVVDGSEDCWLFVKFEEENNATIYLDYHSNLSVANGWTQGDITNIPANVWYRKVLATDSTKTWHLLLDDKVGVDGTTVTKDNMANAATAELIYTAYAHQLHKNATEEFTAAEAWKALNP